MVRGGLLSPIRYFGVCRGPLVQTPITYDPRARMTDAERPNRVTTDRRFVPNVDRGVPERSPLVVRPTAALESPPIRERRILAVLGEARRIRQWVVPSLLRVRALLAEVRVDLRECEIPPDFTMDVRAAGARITLVVPPGVDVAFDAVALLGNAFSQAPETPRVEGRRSIRVTGSVALGEIRVLVRSPGE